jgi:LmbE family N-acetylglucosaminyl deacetylase
MLQLSALPGDAAPHRVLVLGAHADDIEIGCGATMLALQQAHPLDVSWVVLSAHDEREGEARESAEAFLAGAERASVECHRFRDGYLPYVGGEVKDVFEELKGRVEPDLILTHSRDDLHQDHRLVCELTWNTWRDHLILEYEIPKYDGDLGRPNLFVPVSEELAHEKTRLLATAFGSQREKHWFDEELFLGLMRLRGMEAHAASGYAEAFTSRKVSFRV